MQDMGGELAGFQCGAKVGRGPVGASYEGRHNGQPCVVKVLSRRFRQHAGLVERLLGEAGVFEGFRHPNLAGLLKAGSAGGRDILVFERARGEPLSKVLETRGRMPPSNALRVIYEVAQVLAAVQERFGKSCGDIRPEKIYFDGQRAQLTDLGLARASCLGAGHGQAGLPFGDPRYLAPEVMQEEQRDPQPPGDVYALGVLFYQLVCGKPPFSGETEEILAKQLESPLPPPPPDVSFSTKIAGLILRMTAKSPGQRIPDAQTIVTAITRLLEGKPLDLPPIQAAPGPPKPPSAEAPLVEEFDPASLGEDDELVSADKWELTSETMARPGSGEWNRKKIAAAKGKGPQLGAASGRFGAMPSDDELNPIAAAIAEASNERASSSRRTKASSGRTGRSARQTAVSDRPRKKKGLNKRQLMRALGGLAGVAAVMVGLSLIPRKPEQPEIVDEQTGQLFVPPPPPAQETTKQIEEAQAKVKEALDDYDDKVDSRIRSRRFRDAMALSEKLDEEVRKSKLGQSRIQEAEQKIKVAADAELDKDLARFKDYLESDQYEEAWGLAKRIGDWALDEKLIDKLQDQVKQARVERYGVVAALKSSEPRFNSSRAESWMRKNLKSWSRYSKLFDAGGLVLDLRDPAKLADDLGAPAGMKATPLQLKKPPRQTEKAVFLPGKAGAVVAFLPVRMERVLDVTVEFMVGDEPAPDADFAVLVGSNERGRDALGLSWGQVPVRSSRKGVERFSKNPPPFEGVLKDYPLRLRLKAEGEGANTRLAGRLDNLTTKGSWEQEFSGQRGTAGYVLLVAKGIDVYVQRVELRGVFDPSQTKN